MKSKFNQIAEKVISVSACLMVLVFAMAFTVLSVCAGISTIVDFNLLSLMACIASAMIARFWFDFLK